MRKPYVSKTVQNFHIVFLKMYESIAKTDFVQYLWRKYTILCDRRPRQCKYLSGNGLVWVFWTWMNGASVKVYSWWKELCLLYALLFTVRVCPLLQGCYRFVFTHTLWLWRAEIAGRTAVLFCPRWCRSSRGTSRPASSGWTPPTPRRGRGQAPAWKTERPRPSFNSQQWSSLLPDSRNYEKVWIFIIIYNSIK